MTLFIPLGSRHLRTLVVPLCMAFLLAGLAQAQQATPASTPLSVQHAPDLSIERAKLMEQQRATKLTLATIIVTALVGFGTLAYNLRNSNRQAQLQAKLKALDVVISAAGPNSARERLTVVEKILGSDLALETQPKDLDVAGVGAGHDQSRKDLLKMLAEHPNRQLEILELWHVVFGETALGKNIRALKTHVQGNPQSVTSKTPPNPEPQADA